VATAHAVRIALTMTNVTEPAIRRVIQPIVRCVDESRDKEYVLKIIDAKFRPTGAIDFGPSGGTLEDRLTSPVGPGKVIERMPLPAA